MDYSKIPPEILANLPVLPPPPGQQSNFANGQTLGPAIIVVNSIFLPLMIIAVSIRIYTKTCIIHSLWLDDYACIVGALGSLTHSILEYLAINDYGYGYHLWDYRVVDFTLDRIHMYNAIPIVYPLVVFAIKLSFLFFYDRLFGVQRGFRFTVYWAIAVQTFFYTGYFIYQVCYFNICSRPDQQTIPFCLNTSPVVISQGAFNVLTDFFILALPVRKVLQLHLRRGQKINLCLVFASGFVACAISLARLIFSAVRYGDPDSIYWGSVVTMFSIIEINIGICAACMTSLPPFFNRSKIFKLESYSSMRSKLFTSRKKTSFSSDIKDSHPTSDENNTYFQLKDTYRGNANAMTVRGELENLSVDSSGDAPGAGGMGANKV